MWLKSNCDKNPKLKLWQNSKCYNIKNSKFYKTQKIKIWQTEIF